MMRENSGNRATEGSRAYDRTHDTAALITTAQTVSSQDNSWRLEPHVCRVCFSRIASRKTDRPGERLYQCSNCGLEAAGHKAAVVCGCGIKLRKHKGDGRSGEVLADAGIRCHENAKRSPEFPSLYVCSFAGAQASS